MQKKQTRISKTVESQDIKKNMVQVNNKFDDHVSKHHFDSKILLKGKKDMCKFHYINQSESVKASVECKVDWKRW